MNAFWYEGSYYLPPADRTDAAVFLHELSAGVPVELRKLSPEHAFPPFFAAERVGLVRIAIDATAAYPVDVVVLPSAEIERKASYAETKCQLCHWRGGEDAKGAFRCPALTLYATCPLRDEGFDPGFLFDVAAFWERIRHLLPQLTRLLGKNALANAARRVERQLAMLPAVFVAFGRDGDRPVLMFSGAGNDFLHLVAQYLAYTAPEVVTKQFDVLAHFPKGVYRRLPFGRRDPLERRPPQISCQPVRTDRPRFDLTVLVPAAASEDAADDAFLFLAERLGEPLLMGAMNSIRFVDDSGFDLDYHEKAIDPANPKFVTVSVEQYARVVGDAYKAEPDRSGLESPFCFYEYYDLSTAETAGEYADIRVVDTCHMDLVEDLVYGHAEAIADVFAAGMGVGSIAIDLPIDAPGAKERIRRLDELLNRFVHFAGGSVPFGVGLAGTRTFFFFLVTDKRIVRNAVRGLTPVLAAHRAVYREVWPNGSTAAAVGFDLVLPTPE